MIQSVVSLAPSARHWQGNTHQPEILHVFDTACNLINERKEVLSIVTEQIGDGPFNLVIAGDVLFSTTLDIRSPISIHPDQIILDGLVIGTSRAKLWSPRPDWEMLHGRIGQIIHQLAALPSNHHRPLLPAALLTELSATISSANIPSAVSAAAQLAGLGPGLTPAGDDFIMGAILAAWVLHPVDVAQRIAEEIANMAVPLTTSLSAAWPRCAGKGEAGILWHNFLEALISSNIVVLQETVNQLQAVGHTSGTDALAGFLGTLIAYVKSEGNHVLLELVR